MIALVGAFSDVWVYFKAWAGTSMDVGDEVSGAWEGEDGSDGGGESSLVRLGMASKRYR